MKFAQNLLLSVFFLLLLSPNIGNAQAADRENLICEVNRTFDYISITREKLKSANTLIDLNRWYRPDWVKEYIAVEISAIHQGQIKTVVSNSESLSSEQKGIMASADPGSHISVVVQYIPNNNLQQNNSRTLDFSIFVEPQKDASFIGGQPALDKYLKENAVDKIPNEVFDGRLLAAVTFTITEEGEVSNARVYESSKNQIVDTLLLKAIQGMPCWQAAEYADGTNIPQEFALTIGNQESCVVNLLNVRRD